MSNREHDTLIGLASAAARNVRQGLAVAFSFLVWSAIFAGYGLAVWIAILPQPKQ